MELLFPVLFFLAIYPQPFYYVATIHSPLLPRVLECIVFAEPASIITFHYRQGGGRGANVLCGFKWNEAVPR